MIYMPDSWVIVKISLPEQDTYYKVLAGWSGGYLSSDSWRMNSGITGMKLIGNYYLFYGVTDSVYRCHKDGETMRMSQANTWETMKEQAGDAVEIVKVSEIEEKYFL